MAKWYILGGNSNGFWDPKQPDADHQFLYLGQALPLEVTDNVMAWKKAGGLVEVSESEAADINKTFDAKRAAEDKANITAKTKIKNDAQDKINAAAKKEQEAVEALNKANSLTEDAKKVLDENETLKKQVEEMQKQIDDNAKKGAK